MSNTIDLLGVFSESPFLIILLQEKEVRLQIFFSVKCSEVMIDSFKNGDDYRTAFIRAVYSMFLSTNSSSKSNVDETDFAHITDSDLEKVVSAILSQDEALCIAYNNQTAENIFERFYNANINVISETVEPISRTISNFANSFHYARKPLIDSFQMNYSQNINPIFEVPKLVCDTDLRRFSGVISDFSLNYMNTFESVYFPPIDIEGILFPLRSLYEKTLTINNSLVQIMNNSISDLQDTMKSVFGLFDSSILGKIFERKEERSILLNHGWMFSVNLPDEIIEYLIAEKENLTTENVDKLILTFFRKDKCKELKYLVNGWRDLPCFSCRTRIFHEALVNHSRRYFNTSVTLTTIHIEGVITDFVRLKFGNPRFKVQKALRDIKNELDNSTGSSLFEYEVFCEIIDKIEQAFVEKFEPSNPNTASNSSRHKIAHGHAYECESEINSLKQFLYLHEIYRLLSLLDRA